MLEERSQEGFLEEVAFPGLESGWWNFVPGEGAEASRWVPALTAQAPECSRQGRAGRDL